MTFYIDTSWIFAVGGCLFGFVLLAGLLVIAAQAGRAKKHGK